MLKLLQTMALIDDCGGVLTVYFPSSSNSDVAAAASYLLVSVDKRAARPSLVSIDGARKKRGSIEHPERESSPNNNSSPKLPELPKLLFVPSRSDPPGPGQGGRKPN
ncbi:hypothetical protein TRV_03737 [Trichophyton verrucosum HKI 0517]|uniref:Uncharacterized protein n=1 Tax=Trichophyton verrucosum (strain HKI 0517) TaxID=663202 RepID=D4D9E6_TRIVH|nr:uncharacterized protein TRV_03737 [Trichophyton verrucosum HKI 0517]EFE41516.1 hypothetical protein TRV_03737 [Trichophyton verrucosum HKI 0517]